MKADKYTTPESRYAVAEWVVRTVCNKERGLFDGYEVQGEVGERKYVDMTYKLSLDEKIKKLNEEKEAKEQTLKEEDESEEGKATDDGEIEEVT
jgi:hypothetical protein